MSRVIGFDLSSQDPEGAAGKPGIGGGVGRGPADFPHGTRIHIEVADLDATERVNDFETLSHRN